MMQARHLPPRVVDTPLRARRHPLLLTRFATESGPLLPRSWRQTMLPPSDNPSSHQPSESTTQLLPHKAGTCTPRRTSPPLCPGMVPGGPDDKSPFPRQPFQLVPSRKPLAQSRQTSPPMLPPAEPRLTYAWNFGNASCSWAVRSLPPMAEATCLARPDSPTLSGQRVQPSSAALSVQRTTKDPFEQRCPD